MTWSYSGDPSTSTLDMIRFKLGDVRADDPKISNEEIQAIITLEGEDKAVVTCAKFLMMKYAGDIDYSIGKESVKASDLYKHYKELYEKLSSDYKAAHTVPQQIEYTPPIFSVGMMDHIGR